MTASPRPATELFPESLNLSPKQRDVLDALHAYPEGAKASSIASDLGMHVNTARGHLDELVAKDAVRVETAPAEGRGRPSLIFRVRIPDNREIANEYVTLIEILSRAIIQERNLSPETLESAREIGRQWSTRMPHGSANANTELSAQEAYDFLTLKLREMGFDPNTRSEGVMALNSCPFVTDSATIPSPFICAIHEGFVQQTLEDNKAPLSVRLMPLDRPGQCSIRFSTQAES